MYVYNITFHKPDSDTVADYHIRGESWVTAFAEALQRFSDACGEIPFERAMEYVQIRCCGEFDPD